MNTHIWRRGAFLLGVALLLSSTAAVQRSIASPILSPPLPLSHASAVPDTSRRSGEFALRTNATTGETHFEASFAGGGVALRATSIDYYLQSASEKDARLPVFVGEDGNILTKQERIERKRHKTRLKRKRVQLTYVHAGMPVPQGVGQPLSYENVLIGNDPAAWQVDAPSYQSVLYPALYPGIDLRYEHVDNALKSTYVVQPQADSRRIAWTYKGLQDIQLRDDGALVLTPHHQGPETYTFVEAAPIAWQDIDGVRTMIPISYQLDTQVISFAIGLYDPAYPLTIDPFVVFASYEGTSDSDSYAEVDVDSSGNIYTIGEDASFVGEGYDYYITARKFSPSGTLLWTTRLGAPGTVNGLASQTGSDVLVDSSGVYITGQADSGGLPTPNGYRTTFAGGTDIYFAKLSPSTGTIQYGTYIGNTTLDGATGLAKYASRIYVSGWTSGPQFPTRSAKDTTYNGGVRDGVIVSFDPTRTGDATMVVSTYFGGSGDDIVSDIVAGGSSLYIVGNTSSSESSFPETTTAYDKTYNGGTDVFVANLGFQAQSVVYASYLGGTANDTGESITFTNGKGTPYIFVTGSTLGGLSGFPVKPSPAPSAAGANAFVSAFNVSTNTSNTGTSTLLYSLRLGGAANDYGSDIIAEGDGRVTVVGASHSADFPEIQTSPLEKTSAPDGRGFVTRIDEATPNSTTPPVIIHSTQLNHAFATSIAGVDLDQYGVIYAVGEASGPGYGNPSPVPGQEYSGGSDGLLLKIYPEYAFYNSSVATFESKFCRWTRSLPLQLTYTYEQDPDLAVGLPWYNVHEEAILRWEDTGLVSLLPATSQPNIEIVLEERGPANVSGTGIAACSDTNTGEVTKGILTSYRTLYDGTPTNPTPPYNVNGNYIVTIIHELGHTFALYHPSSYVPSVMGTNPFPDATGATTRFYPQDADKDFLRNIYAR